ncbi:MAG: winged helix-turn-helix domain-containing protein [Bacteroidales bacterium]|jgi:cell division protein FtsB|nr:winged helix-turn-helix domain-containing protein [Bacteroidales bacterium]
MKTAYQNKTASNSKPKRSVWDFLGGNFLLSSAMRHVYFYLFFLGLLGGVMIFNEKRIAKKEKEIKQLHTQYKQIISELSKYNQNLEYDSVQKLVKMLEDKGFVKDDNQVYKIQVTNDIEHGE